MNVCHKCCLLALSLISTGCLTRSAERREPSSQVMAPEATAADIQTGLNRLAEIDAKVKRLQPYVRGKQEAEILRVSAQTLRWAVQNNLWPDVTLEDLLAHARQESNDVLNRLDAKREIRSIGGIGSSVWDFRMVPTNDLNGFVSYSVWQAVEVNYLTVGRLYDEELNRIYKDYIVKYSFDGVEEVDPETLESAPWGYKEKIAAAEGEAQAKKLIDQLLRRISKRTTAHPELHVKVIAHLIQANYDTFGVRSPDAIRNYFWLEIQRSLNPDNWLQPVIVKNDQSPASTGGTDIHADKRGDYGKQVALGNSYNDRGMIYWYTVSGDDKRRRQLIDAWKNDPARLRKADYQKLKDSGFLKYMEKQPDVFEKVMAALSE